MATVKKVTKKRPPKKNIADSKKQTVTPPKVVPTVQPIALAGAWRHLLNSFRLVRQHWRFFALFSLTYALISFILVHNITSDVNSVKSNISTIFSNNGALTAIGTYTLVLTTSTTGASSTTAAYQYGLFVLVSLAVIWALRQFMSDTPSRPTVRDSWYKGMYPLVPFILVLLVLSLEFIPLAAAGGLYAAVVANGIAVNVAQQFIWLLVFIVGAVMSLWLLTRSLFAMYIVTLPGGTPMQSLRDSFRITKPFQYRVARSVLLLALSIIVVSAALLVPTIAVAPGLTGFLLFVFGVVLLPFAHVYLYGVYRDLLA